MRALRRSKEAVKCFRYSTLVPLPTQTKGGGRVEKIIMCRRYIHIVNLASLVPTFWASSSFLNGQNPNYSSTIMSKCRISRNGTLL